MYRSADITDDVLVIFNAEKFFRFEQSLHVSPRLALQLFHCLFKRQFRDLGEACHKHNQ